MSAWIDEGGEPRLRGLRCGACGTIFYPAPMLCGACGSPDLAAHPLSGSGELYVHSRIRVTSQTRPLPYVVAYVDLPEGVRVFGQLDVAQDAEPPPLGGKVALYPGAVGVAADGGEIVGLRFRESA